MKVWLFPIEPLVERYSADWYNWWPSELLAAGFDIRVVDGQRVRDGLVQGEFLDPIDTHYYKATQLASFCRSMQDREVEDGDIVLLLDGWNPAVTSLAYMRDTIGPDFRIAGCLHAGTWDEWDYLSQKGLRRWAKHTEQGWFNAFDRIFLATRFHKGLLYSGLAETDRNSDMGKVLVTGFPLLSDCVTEHREALLEDKDPIVVFPHRLSPEKQPDVFDTLKAAYVEKYGVDAEWVMTKHVCRTKADYYDLLARSKVSVSTAMQETWGIAMIESMMLGCWPVAPDRLSYPETVPREMLYGSLEEAADLIHTALKQPSAFRFSNPWSSAIEDVAAALGSM